MNFEVLEAVSVRIRAWKDLLRPLFCYGSNRSVAMCKIWQVHGSAFQAGRLHSVTTITKPFLLKAEALEELRKPLG